MSKKATQQNNRILKIALTQNIDERHAIHAGHSIIRHNQIKLLLLDKMKRFAGTGSRHYMVAEFLQDAATSKKPVRVVIYQQNRCGFSCVKGRSRSHSDHVKVTSSGEKCQSVANELKDREIEFL